MNRVHAPILVLTALLATAAMNASGREFRLSQMPNASQFGCGTCHVSPGGGGPRNPYGRAVEAIVRPGLPDPFWTPTLAALDSDGDGFTNGEEVGDPDGDGTPEPGHVVTNPGNASSRPDPVNEPPTITITAPADGAILPAPGEVSITAEALDSDGTIVRVEFFREAVSLGLVTEPPFTVLATLAAGTHSLTARATDDDDASTTSAAISVTVQGGENTPPTVAVTAPTQGTVLTGPIVAAVTAEATDSDGSIARVEFLDGDQVLGTVTTPPYSLDVDWSVGTHTIAARAVDNQGGVTTSAVVEMVVNAPDAPTLDALVRNADSAELTWSGGGGPFAVQTKSTVSDPWCSVSDVVTNRAFTTPLRGAGGFLRVADLASQGPVPLTAVLRGDFERPNPVAGSGSGSGTFKVVGNTLTFDIQYAGLSGPAMQAHIHGPAGIEQSTNVLINLAPFNGGEFGVAGTLSGSVILTPFQKAAILSGRTYVNVHTEQNGSGEIRGQILPVLMQALLAGANERPDPVVSPAQGRGLFLLTGDQLTFEIAYGGLSGPASMAHIHGPADQETSATVLINLAPFNGGAFGTSGSISGTVTLTPAQLAAVAGGLTYANIHTEANPSGEIRGQILPCVGGTPLTARLSGEFERPDPVTTAATGSAILALEGDMLLFSVRYGGLSGPAVAAHIHGPATTATSTNVLINLQPFNGGAFGVNGTFSGSVLLTAEQKAMVLGGLTYVNVHTEAHGSGEIRGQVAAVLRTATMSGANERPNPVDTAASGSGHFLLVQNRLWMNVTYRGLSGPAVAAHIHGPADATMSTNVLLGLQTFNLGGFGVSGAFGGTAELDVPTHTALVDGLTYLNVHTEAHGSGEIRGQILRPGNP